MKKLGTIALAAFFGLTMPLLAGCDSAPAGWNAGETAAAESASAKPTAAPSASESAAPEASASESGSAESAAATESASAEPTAPPSASESSVPESSSASGNGSEQSGAQPGNSAGVTYEQAISAAMAGDDTALPVYCELDYERGALVYEIELISGGAVTEYIVDAQTGMITASKSEADPPEFSVDAVTVDYRSAVSAALAQGAGYTFKGFEIDMSAAGLIYEIEVFDPDGFVQEVYVQAESGEYAGVSGASPAPSGTPARDTDAYGRHTNHHAEY